MKLWVFLLFCVVMTSFIYPIHCGNGWWIPRWNRILRRTIIVVHLWECCATRFWFIFQRGKCRWCTWCSVNLSHWTSNTFILWLDGSDSMVSELIISNIWGSAIISMIFVNTNLDELGHGCSDTIKSIVWKSDLTMISWNNWWSSINHCWTSL